MDEQRKPKDPVAKGKVKKKSGLTKLADIFLPEDRGSMREYILEDVLVPYLKKIADDAFHLFLYGRGSSRSNSSNSSGSRTYYSSIYDGSKPQQTQKKIQKQQTVDDILFDTRQDAEKVLMRLREELKQYPVVTVLDLCEFAEVSSNATDAKYGWSDLTSADIVRVRDGYVLSLPRPMPVD